MLVTTMGVSLSYQTPLITYISHVFSITELLATMLKAINSVCWRLCISKTETQMSEQHKRPSKDREEKRTNTSATFWAYGSDDFLRSGTDGSSARDDHPRVEGCRGIAVWRRTLLITSCTFSDRKWHTHTHTDWQHAEVMIISKKRLSHGFVFTCWGLSGFAGWAWLSMIRICWAVQFGGAHVQKESFLNVINNCKAVSIAKSDSVKYTTDALIKYTACSTKSLH